MRIINEAGLKMLQHLTIYFGLMAALGLFLWVLPIANHTFELVMGQVALLGLLLVINWNKIKEIELQGPRISWRLVLVSIITGSLLSIATRWYQLKLLQHGIIVAPGTSQLNMTHYDIATIDLLFAAMVVVCLGPALEEFVFRFMGLGVASRAVIAPRLASKKWANIFIICWLVVLSILFAFIHQPDGASFPVYFIAGVIYSIAYLKYGLFSSILVHSASNATALLFFIF